MLSTELTKVKDECHLKAFLDRVNAPHSIPKGSPEERKFKQSVLDRLEQRELEAKQYSDKTIRSGGGSFLNSKPSCCSCPPSSCCRCCSRSGRGGKSGGSGAIPEIVWRRLECKDLESFEAYATAAVTSNLNIIRCLKAINQSLSFWEDPRPDWEGLSVLGCYGWILSFTLQHLMDEDDPKDPTLLAGLDKIRELYTEMAQSSELFIDMVEAFYEHSQRLRSDALYTVKKLVKKWKLEKQSPLLKLPEKGATPEIREPGRRIGTGMLDTELDASSFHLNWTPVRVMLKSRKMSIGWHEFSGLILVEKLHWFKVFAQHTVDQLQLEAEDMHIICGQLSGINIADEGGGDSGKKGGSSGSATNNTFVKSHAREISGAMIQFSKIAKYPMSKNGGGGGEGGDQEVAFWVRLISEVWFSAEFLAQEAAVLLRVVRETRDILRTCYVYVDVFYKMGLPSYDEFLAKGALRGGQGRGQTRDGKGKKGGKQPGTIRGVWEKFVSKDGRKLSDIAEMLVMSDFSTSIYQRIVETRAVEAEDMLMKLESHNLDDKLSSGLVSGMSVKSKK